MSDMELAVYVKDETLAQSIYADFVTGAMVAFCVYISQDSTWWTFVTGIMFMVFAFAKISAVVGRGTKKFKTKSELQKWVDDLPDDTP